jgi:hypothetical protein
MMYVVGVVLAVLGAWFAYSGYGHKQRSQAELARLRSSRPGEKDPELHPSLSMLADFAPSLTVFSLGSFAVLITVAFFAVGAQRWLSYLDLAGMYVMAGGYGYWMYMKTRHRSVETLQALAQKAAAQPAGVSGASTAPAARTVTGDQPDWSI